MFGGNGRKQKKRRGQKHGANQCEQRKKEDAWTHARLNASSLLRQGFQTCNSNAFSFDKGEEELLPHCPSSSSSSSSSSSTTTSTIRFIRCGVGIGRLQTAEGIWEDRLKEHKNEFKNATEVKPLLGLPGWDYDSWNCHRIMAENQP